MDAATGAELASLLKRFRTQPAGLSQQMLADRALISAQAISALERGSRKVPYKYTLNRIAEALGLSEEARAELDRSARRARGSRLEESAAVPEHNLPRQTTALFGRAGVVAEIAGLLEEAPLVSIVGTGGAGKTRVAVAVGAASLNKFADGVWFVELAPLNDPALVAHALAAALRVQELSTRPLLETLIGYLGRKRTLVVFDNCEHVISGTRAVVGSILRECPKVAMLATSREALGVPGERVYRIPPLAVPRGEIPTPEAALHYAAVELFADRMRAVDTRAALTHANVEPIVEICRRLEGLPLALELAAARTAVLSPSRNLRESRQSIRRSHR